MKTVHVIGGGLAGSEAAWQLASRQVPVSLIEMRPHVKTGAHRSEDLAEIVCTNSFKSTLIENASGLLKAEMAVSPVAVFDQVRWVRAADFVLGSAQHSR